MSRTGRRGGSGGDGALPVRSGSGGYHHAPDGRHHLHPDAAGGKLRPAGADGDGAGDPGGQAPGLPGGDRRLHGQACGRGGDALAHRGAAAAVLQPGGAAADGGCHGAGPQRLAGHHPAEHMAAHRQGISAAVQAAVLPPDAFHQAPADRRHLGSGQRCGRAYRGGLHLPAAGQVPG